jgi:hypothetical protein
MNIGHGFIFACAIGRVFPAGVVQAAWSALFSRARFGAQIGSLHKPISKKD